MQEQKPKSAFAPMRAQINVELADRLIRQAEEAQREVKPALPAVATPVATSQAQLELGTSAPPPSSVFTVALEIEVVDDLEKISPSWGYVRAFTLGAVLNRAYEPSRSAVYARDFASLRWLTMLAIVKSTLRPALQ
jgi:hypothetical protein